MALTPLNCSALKRREIAARSPATVEGQVPLYLTPHSLSLKTAFGVQTQFLLKADPCSLHAYWYSSEIRAFGHPSFRLESLLFSRLSLFKRDRKSGLVHFLRKLGLSWWDGNTLKPKKKTWLKEHLAHRTSAIYVAPSETRDCERIRDILMTLNKPFVLHLWDVLDDGQADSSAFCWLLEHASHVLCVSAPLARYLAPVRPDAQILCFSREPSPYKAGPRGTGPLRIILIGYCQPHTAGLRLLNNALRLLKQEGQDVDLVYIGSQKAARHWSKCFDQKVQSTGFVSSADVRDKLLSQGHVGFLPGPLLSPETDLRSRFSIPSRTQDFLAVGLPLIATVHRESATAGYLQQIGLEGSLVADAQSLADKLRQLSRSAPWTDASKRIHAAFSESCQPRPDLKRLLCEAAATSRFGRRDGPALETDPMYATTRRSSGTVASL